MPQTDPYGRPVGLGRGRLAAFLSGLATLPQRALGASEMMRTQGPYDPAAPVEAAMLPLGISAPRAVLGAGKLDLSTLPSLYLHRKAPERIASNYAQSAFDVINDAGKNVANMSVTYIPKEKTVYVNGLYTNLPGSPLDVGNTARQLNPSAHIIGAKDIRTLLMAIKNEYPEATKIEAFRASGARWGEGAIKKLDADAALNIPKISDERMQQYLAGADAAKSKYLAEQGPRLPSLAELQQRAPQETGGSQDWLQEVMPEGNYWRPRARRVSEMTDAEFADFERALRAMEGQ